MLPLCESESGGRGWAAGVWNLFGKSLLISPPCPGIFHFHSLSPSDHVPLYYETDNTNPISLDHPTPTSASTSMLISTSTSISTFDTRSGGHSGVTIVPLLSQTSVAKGVQGEPYKALVKRIQFGGDGQ
jgi:hypothetical protein